MMDQLENQVSDLRSFLDPNATNPTATTTATGTTGGGPVPVPAAAPPLLSGHGTPQPPQPPPSFHASAGAGLRSAPYGDNSAHNSPISISPPPHHQYHQQNQHAHHHNQNLTSSANRPPTSASNASNAAAAKGNQQSKRQASEAALSDDGAPGSSSGKQQRAKRNRYISIACNECKRRKIKCNGQTPCQRCGHLNLQCLYAPNCCTNNFKDSDEYKQMNEQVGRLQEQVDALFNSLNALRQETVRLAPIQQDRILPLPSSVASTPTPSIPSIPHLPKPVTSTLRVPPSFNGPTSIAFTVDVAKNTLHNMGYTGGDDQRSDRDDNNGINHEPTPQGSPSLQPIGTGRSPSTSTPLPADPLWSFSREEMIQLCRFHEEEVGIMYPVIKIDHIIEHAKKLSTWMESAKRHGLASSGVGQDGGISDHTTLILKIVMCCALTVMEHGKSTRAEQLYDSIQPIVDKMLMSEPADVTKLPFLALVAGYRFLGNEEILAWRVMGHVARLCFELGLHRREGLERIPDAQDRRNALNTFWSAYVLDRRWGFGTGLPFVCHDDKIDPGLPMPDDYPYLVAMISYSKLGAKIWKLVDYFEPALIRDLKPHDIETLDHEILNWYETVPESIKVPSLDPEVIPVPSKGPNYDLQRLQVWTRLRLNQIRTWLHTPVLHSASSIAENMYLATKTVGFAKETIRYLAMLNKSTGIYQRIQTFYHQFLTSAISVLFLASTHAPLSFSAGCRGEFYLAMDLVKDMSERSWVSQRLWKTIRSLKAYAPRLGLEEDGSGGASRGVGGRRGLNRGMGIVGRGTTVGHGYHQAVSGGQGQGGQYSPGSGTFPGGSIGSGGFGNGNGNGNGGLAMFNNPDGTGRGAGPGIGHHQQHTNVHDGGMAGSSNVSSPSPGLSQQQQGHQQGQWITSNSNSSSEDLSNGMRLQSEMSRIYEGFTGIDVLPSLQTLQRSQIFPVSNVSNSPPGGSMMGRASTGQQQQQQQYLGSAGSGGGQGTGAMSPAGGPGGDGGGGGGGGGGGPGSSSSVSVGVASPASNGSVGVYGVMRDMF